MKRKFLINPASGGGLPESALAAIRAFFIRRTGEFDAVVGRSRAHVHAETFKALGEGYDQIVAVGGDGMVNAVVNGFFEKGRPIRPKASLAVACLGSGCDYFRTLIRGAHVKDWREIVLSPEIRPVDLGRIDFVGRIDAPTYFINMASVGMSAEVAMKKERLPRWVPNFLSYLLPTLQQIGVYRPRRTKITADDTVLETEILAAFIAKGVYAGGGMRFGGGVALDDGWFDVTVFEKMRPIEMILKMGRLYTGGWHHIKGIRKLKARRIAVESDDAIPMEFEGETGHTTDFQVSIQEKAVRVCLPRK
jgi:YegS/Rv2252/BmrU family lipid kinase